MSFRDLLYAILLSCCRQATEYVRFFIKKPQKTLKITQLLNICGDLVKKVEYFSNLKVCQHKLGENFTLFVYFTVNVI